MAPRPGKNAAPPRSFRARAPSTLDRPARRELAALEKELEKKTKAASESQYRCRRVRIKGKKEKPYGYSSGDGGWIVGGAASCLAAFESMGQSGRRSVHTDKKMLIQCDVLV